MKIYSYTNLSKQNIEDICLRTLEDDAAIAERVGQIINQVKTTGDQALLDYAGQFDGVKLERLFLDEQEIETIASEIPQDAREAIETAYANIRMFHAAQLKTEDKIETMPGVSCWRESRPISRVGLYIPGGSAVLPSTFLMLGIPAMLAGCEEIVVCSPPQKDGKTNCYLAYCAKLLGIKKIYLAGGAQAIAAMAYGTTSVPQVYKIFGPGNRYVTQAKQQILASGIAAIDMPAGPSEVLIIADRSASPAFVAADLLAQAEHGSDSQSILVSTSTELIAEVMQEIDNQISYLPRATVAAAAIANSYAVHCENLQQAMAFSNAYAPEHLILATEEFEALIPQISNAGSVFLGNLTPESAGDYASGTNHTLPTSGFAKAYSGVSTDSFLKKITFQHITPSGLKAIGPAVEILATAEGLQAHKNAITIRLKSTDGY
ncbi:histidinol dehydrogenase [Pedobacter antarcticus]|uniref:histidinol dehydrogenase n=1 Tax=Pedobacter antarcticus TaxID=34086 RepID=UPI0008893A69|nr:histidinol dehydrogenase [Pedobacter antarcticus]SDM67023.1 histidinol dehydrogenase [Pedobacter antarcticus]